MNIYFLIILYFINTKVDAYNQLVNYEDIFNVEQKSPALSINDDICDYELLMFQQALENNESWAVRFVDTWAKINAGYLSGNTMNVGDFDSCVRFQDHTASSRIFQGQHCFVALSARQNSTLIEDRTDLSLKNLANFFRNNGIVTRNGFCMPATCSNEKVVEFLNQNYLFNNDLIASRAVCRNIHDVQLDAVGYFAIVLFSLFAVIIAASTIYDIITTKSENSEQNKLLASFSVYTNGMKLFDMTKIKSPSSLNCLHGLRGMSIFWIIFGHRFANNYFWGNFRDFQTFLNERTIFSAIIITHPLAVDTFFVMGASLMTMSTLRDCEKHQLNIFRMIWRRYIRYTPAYAALILFVVAFTNMLFQGPFYVAGLRDPCLKNWWLALLHIQNYFEITEMCLNHGWYLSVDFQLFIISPFIIYFINKFGRKLLTIPALLFATSIIYIISISSVKGIQVSSLRASNDFLNLIYYPIYSRGGPWFAGMILGYFLYFNRGKTFQVNKLFNAFMWILALSTLSSIVLLQFAFFTAEEPLPQALHSIYLGLQRNLWGVAICWIVFACQHLKTGGIIRWFLSWPQWQPISRMGLSMYLIGFVYQIYMMFNQRSPLYMNFWQVVPVLISDIVITAILATFSYLAFEAPPLIIEDYVYKKFKNKE